MTTLNPSSGVGGTGIPVKFRNRFTCLERVLTAEDPTPGADACMFRLDVEEVRFIGGICVFEYPTHPATAGKVFAGKSSTTDMPHLQQGNNVRPHGVAEAARISAVVLDESSACREWFEIPMILANDDRGGLGRQAVGYRRFPSALFPQRRIGWIMMTFLHIAVIGGSRTKHEFRTQKLTISPHIRILRMNHDLVRTSLRWPTMRTERKCRHGSPSGSLENISSLRALYYFDPRRKLIVAGLKLLRKPRFIPLP